MKSPPSGVTTAKLLFVALLAAVTYLPALSQPFVEDDYPIILLARSYGPVSGWTRMAQDKVNRVRATTFVLTHWIESLAGLTPLAFYSVGLLIHTINCWLILALGRWKFVGYDTSFLAACFFAIYEGHQEAVMWYAAANELLLFGFAIGFLLTWSRFLESRNWRWLLLSVVSFVLALLSKESSVVIVPLSLLVVYLSGEKSRQKWTHLPFVAIAVVYAALIFQTRDTSFRFRDQSFVLSAPFWETWTKSFFGLLLPWGWLAIVVLLSKGRDAVLKFGLAWVAISFVPYMFIDYTHAIPSRQTYLASLGLALIVGAAVSSMLSLKATRSWQLATSIVLFAVLAHNISYVWLVKHKQFLARAQPTEHLISFARKVDGPIYVRCFPRPPIIADAAVEVATARGPGTLIWDESEAHQLGVVNTFCEK